MAIQQIGSTVTGAAGNGNNPVLTLPSGIQEGDVVVVIGGWAQKATTGTPEGPSEAGYTRIQWFSTVTTSATGWGWIGAWYKVMGPTPDSSVTGQALSVTSVSSVYHAVVLRGVDTTNVVDNQTTQFVANGATGTPDPPTVNVESVGAWVFACGFTSVVDATATAPTGYTGLAWGSQNDTYDTSLGFAIKQATAIGIEDPGAFSGLNSGENPGAFTFAIRPEPVATETIITASDSAAITVSESVSTTKSVGASDAASLSIAESAGTFKTIVASDTLSIGIDYGSGTPAANNDNFADALEVVIPTNGGTYTSPLVNNSEFTTEVGEPDQSASDAKSAWWKYTPTSSGTASLDTALSTAITNTDTYVAIWTGTNFGDMVLLTFNDDGGPNATSAITWEAQAGVTYWIQCGAYGLANINYVMRVTGPAMPSSASGSTIVKTDAPSTTPVTASESNALAVSETTSLFITKVASDTASLSVNDLGTDEVVPNLRNYSFEADTNPWLSNQTLTRVNTDAHHGSWSARIAVTTTTNSNLFSPTTSDFATVAGQTWSASGWVKWDAGTARSVRLDILFRDGTTDLITHQGTVTPVTADGWVQLRNENKVAPANTQFVRYRLVAVGTTAGDAWLADDLALEPVSALADTASIEGSDTVALTITESSNASTSLPGTDTTALAVSETAVVVVSLSRTDTAAISVAESVVRDKTLSQSDTSALSVSESVSILVTLSRTDTASLAVIETTSSFRTIATTDTSSIAATETAAVDGGNFLPGSDTSALGVVDTASVAVFTSRDDSLNIGLTETQTSGVSLSNGDGGVIIGVETASLSSFGLISGTDGGALLVSESRTIDSALARTETTALSVSETTASFRTVVAADAMSLSVAESAGNGVTQSDDDTATLSVNETLHLFRQGVRGTESIALAVEDGGSLFKAVDANDNISVSLTEVDARSATLPGTDSVTIGVAEETAISSEGVADDSASLGLDESASVAVSLSRDDGVVILLTEAASTFSAKAAADGGSVMVAETSSESAIGAESTTDTASFGLTEHATVDMGVVTSDALTLQVTESQSGLITQTAVDGAGLRVSETRSQNVTVSRSDAVNLSVGETADSGQFNSVTATDAGSLAVTENNTLSSRLNRFDNASLSVVETITAFGSRPGGENLTIGVLENATVNVFIEETGWTSPGVDPMLLIVSETTEVKIPVTAIDGGALGVVDSGQAVGRETDTVLVLVYKNGQWVQGTMMVYRAGRWRVATPKAFRDGAWSTD